MTCWNRRKVIQIRYALQINVEHTCKSAVQSSKARFSCVSTNSNHQNTWTNRYTQQPPIIWAHVFNATTLIQNNEIKHMLLPHISIVSITSVMYSLQPYLPCDYKDRLWHHPKPLTTILWGKTGKQRKLQRHSYQQLKM